MSSGAGEFPRRLEDHAIIGESPLDRLRRLYEPLLAQVEELDMQLHVEQVLSVPEAPHDENESEEEVEGYGDPEIGFPDAFTHYGDEDQSHWDTATDGDDEDQSSVATDQPGLPTFEEEVAGLTNLLFGSSGDSQWWRLPAFVWTLLGISNDQVTQDVIGSAFNIPTADISWAQNMPMPDLKAMKPWRALAEVGDAVRQWFIHLNNMLFLFEQTGEEYAGIRKEWIAKWRGLREGLLVAELVEGPARFVVVWTFFHGLAMLISNLTHALTQDDGLTLQDLGDMPARHKVLEELVRSTPTDCNLNAGVGELVLSQRKVGKGECAICMASWSCYVPWIIHNPDWHTASWLSLSDDKRTLVVVPGFENVPVKMGCGHVFCAGCLKTLLDTGGSRLQCPFRDMEYGVHQAEAVRMVEKFGRAEGVDIEGLVHDCT